jgi:DNA mismatch repair protein MutS
MSLIKEYFELTKKYQAEYGDKTILLMQVGAFFEVYAIRENENVTESQLSEFSNICELNIVEKNVCVDKKNVLMGGFKDIMIEKYLKKLQTAGYTIVVYTQDQQTKNTTRSCAGIFSPGTYFSNDHAVLTNNLTTIWIDLVENKLLLKGKFVVVGIANIDILTGKTSIYQFKETFLNNPTTFDELERFVSIYNPSEVIMISNLADNVINDVINYANIHSAKIHKINYVTQETDQSSRAKNCEKQIYQKEILKKFYEVDNYDVFFENFYENHIASQAFCFLLDFVFQHNPHLVKKISEPVFNNCSKNLHLANHSLKQLNIIDDNSYKGKYSSVLSMLNDCYTSMGKREFSRILTNPTTDIHSLRNEYDITEHLLNNVELYGTFMTSNLSFIKDLSKLERQIFLKKITPKSFSHLFENIVTIKNIYNKIENDKTILNYLFKINPGISNVPDFCDNLTTQINNHLNLEFAKHLDQISGFDINFINEHVDIELDNKSNDQFKYEQKLQAIRKHLNDMIPEKTKSSDFIKIHETEKNNLALICTSRRCKLLEKSLPDTPVEITINYDENSKWFNEQIKLTIGKKCFEYKTQSASNNFITDSVIKDTCGKISVIKVALKDLISRVYYNFLSTFEENQDKLNVLIDFVTHIDVLFNKARIAIKYNYCKPIIVESEKSFLSAENLRHSLIENLQTNELYIANDITLGNNVSDGVLLYGTNAVGKTSFIRAIGIAVVMAQAGLYVPCSKFIYNPYKYLFTRIIGNDNLFKGLSTFAVEMSELRTILRLADQNSLILGDELCSGTEISSAIGIFVSGIQKLSELKSSFIFATHLHEIVNYTEITEIKTLHLSHMEVVYDKSKDTLIYDRKLKDGPGNNMYGLEVCKSLNLPEDFLTNAFNIRMKYCPEDSSILSLKTSHFNSQKIVGTCEQCGSNPGIEVHHLQYQIEADDNGVIKKKSMLFHKNNLANLMTLCEACHESFHKKGKKQMKRTKTTKGEILEPI